jgi:RNA polymerase sigma-70 factor, ECF subfamily
MTKVPVCPHPSKISETLSEIPPTEPPSSRERDPRLAACLHREHFAYVCRLAQWFGVPAREAEDVAQDVFVIAHRREATFDRGSAPRPWLYAITWRVVGNRRQLARNHREVFGKVVDEAAVSEETPETAFAEAAEGEELRRRVRGLRSKLRIVVEMHVFEGRAVADVAAALALPLKTAQARLTLARNELMRLKDARHFGKS